MARDSRREPMKQARLLLADDHRMFLEGLRRLLEPDFQVIGALHTSRELISDSEMLKPDVVIVDISMPGLNGIEAARRLRRITPAPKIIILSMHSDASFVKESFRAGASGYVVKKCTASELVKAIRTVLRGQTYLCAAAAKGSAVGKREPLSPPSEAYRDLLTPREREVLQLVAEGHTFKEIASVLNFSTKTAEFHKYNMMRKLGFRKTSELMKYALKHGIVDLVLFVMISIGAMPVIPPFSMCTTALSA